MWIRYVALILVTLTGGIAVAGAFVAVITLIGIVPALARQERFFWKRLDMGTAMYLYESLMVAGVMLGTGMNLFAPAVPLGIPGLVVFTFLGGMFTGCLIGALEETLQVFPILSRRTNIRYGMAYLLAAVAAGKFAGSVIYYCLLQLSE